jgi:TolB protein
VIVATIPTPQVRTRFLQIDVWLVCVLSLVTLDAAVMAGDGRSANRASRLIAFVSGDGIYVMRANGINVRQLWRGHASDLAWSPDGRKLAFSRGEFGELGIWVLNANGSGLLRIVRERATSPTWSPAGRRIAFVGDDGVIGIVRADGSNLRRLPMPSTTIPAITRPKDVAVEDVDWSPTGNQLVFTGVIGTVNGADVTDHRHIYSMGTDGSNLHNLTLRHGTSVKFDEEAEWSPEGRRIVFLRDHRIWVMNADGSSPVRLTAWVGAANPVWSQDSRKIAFAKAQSLNAPGFSQIYVINADGTGANRLTGAKVNAAYPAWQPARTP